MTAIGYVTKQPDGGYKGELKTVSIQAEIQIVPNDQKAGPNHPDFRIYTDEVEIGAGWLKVSNSSGKEYVSLSLAAPEFGPRRIYANLGKAAGSGNPDFFAVIWNPVD